MIELRDIEKSYRQGFRTTPVLNGIDLDVEEGGFLTILGPSGSGKTTLLNILGMIDEPTSGIYRFREKNVTGLSEKERTRLHRRKIGIVFQAYHLIDDLTVYENLETPLEYNDVEEDEREERIETMLERFFLKEKAEHYPSQLSGGQQQLVGVARALIHRPDLILADEPTGNLHSRQGEQIMGLFQRINERDGVTIVQVTHAKKWTEYGDRALELVDGEITEERILREDAYEAAGMKPAANVDDDSGESE